MCGIAGIIDLSGSNRATQQNLMTLSSILHHRGPDDEGYLVNMGDKMITCFGDNTPASVRENKYAYCPIRPIDREETYRFGILHRRLSIIDTSPAGHQPMCSQDKSIWITYNGEIYNYIELRKELMSKGYSFTSQTDTEVVISAYQEWGTDCVKRFNGMWAFVIYDDQKKSFFGSRDRTGVKPFYYHFDHKTFSFASELKALHQLDYIENKVNGNATLDFLLFNKVEHRENSIFDGLMELFPAHNFTLNISTSKFEKWKYFEPSYNKSSETATSDKHAQFANKAKGLIETAIQLRLRSDVSIGTCLSGGIDSSSIVSVINQLNAATPNQQIGNQLKAFTCSFRDKDYDESHFAEEVIRNTATEWHQVYPTKHDLFADLGEMTYAQDIPLLSTSTYAQYSVMRLASQQNVKVLLNGQGADELFAGYAQHQYLLEKSKGFSNLITKAISSEADRGAFVRNFALLDALPRMNRKIRLALMNAYYSELSYLNKDYLHEHIDVFKEHEPPQLDSLNAGLKHEYFDGSLKRLLKCEDRNSMHFSIESRTPFADDIDLMNFIFRIPSQFKLHKQTSKSILRDAMESYLPEKIYSRKDKMGFVTPNNNWLTELKDELKDLLLNMDENIFNKPLLVKDFDTFLSPKSATENYRIFKFISFIVWQSEFKIRA